jgi:site-specific DNA-methyltransferase (adenine-specific)
VARVEATEPKKRRSTSTSDFGVGKREGHDASDFYARFAAPKISAEDRISDAQQVRSIDQIFLGSSADMSHVADGSVALVVTSPPYFAGKAYETELESDHVPATYLDYLQMLRAVFAECVRTLEPGGRIAVNVANLGRRPYRSLSADVTTILQDDLRLLLRGEVVWVKQRGASGSCAWGSFQRATNPVLRDLTERVIIASKGRFDRPLAADERKARGLPYESTMYRDEFMDATLDMWEIPPESAQRVGHPAPFPVALPERLINLYSYKGDLILDPFMGSGTTAVAAVKSERHFVGYDTDADYVHRAKERIAQTEIDLQEGPIVPSAEAGNEDWLQRCRREGLAAKEVARRMLMLAGFEQFGPIAEGAKVAGVEFSFCVLDASGQRLLVDFSGAFTSARPGLKRGENLFRSLGKASALSLMLSGQAAEGVKTQVLLMSTDAPGKRSANGRALCAALDPTSGTIAEIVLLDEAGLSTLIQLAEGLRPGSAGWAASAWTEAYG